MAMTSRFRCCGFGTEDEVNLQLRVPNTVEYCGNHVFKNVVDMKYFYLRFFMLCYCVGITVWNFVSYVERGYPEYWIMYISQWMLIIGTLYFIVISMLTLYLIEYIKHHNNVNNVKSPNYDGISNVEYGPVPIFMRIAKILFSIAVTGEIIIVSAYWILIFPFDTYTNPNELASTIHIHGVMCILVYIDYYISTLYLAYQYIMYPLIFSISYVIWSLIFSELNLTALGHNYLYAFIDWRSRPLEAGISCAVLFALIFIVYFFMCFLKYMILSKWTFRGQNNNNNTDNSVRNNNNNNNNNNDDDSSKNEVKV